jgi:hypothetical protein
MSVPLNGLSRHSYFARTHIVTSAKAGVQGNSSIAYPGPLLSRG